MRGFSVFMRKEALEIVRTWRIWVLPGIVLLFALTGPVTAKLTPELLRSVAGDQPGVVFKLPAPTYQDAYLQWTKNLAQMVTFAIIIIYGGVVSAERRAGTAVLVLVKPLSRPAFVMAKYVVQAAFLAFTTIIGAFATWGVTRAVFGRAPLAALARGTGAWLVWGLFLLAVMVLLSAMIESQAGAAGLGFGVYLAISLGTLWGPVLRHSPAGMLGAPDALVKGSGGPLAWPLATTAALAVLALLAAVAVFARKEL